MADFVAAAGLVLVIEGLLWALAPGFGVRMLEAASQTPESTLRVAGTIAVLAGVLVVWFVRG